MCAARGQGQSHRICVQLFFPPAGLNKYSFSANVIERDSLFRNLTYIYTHIYAAQSVCSLHRGKKRYCIYQEKCIKISSYSGGFVINHESNKTNSIYILNQRCSGSCITIEICWNHFTEVSADPCHVTEQFRYNSDSNAEECWMQPLMCVSVSACITSIRDELPALG